jgi:hypothetical protein
MPSKGLKDATLDNAPEEIDPATLNLAPEEIDPTEVRGLNDSVLVKNEQPEDLSWYHRAVVKNFSTNPESSVKYLQERYPQYEVTHDKDNILFRKPGENQYTRLDPKGFDWQDLTDVGYDIPGGVATTAASAAGGLAGGVATLPSGGWGAIPGAMAAGAAGGAGVEGVRQGIGSALGLDNNMSLKDVGIASAVGGASPLVFGTGAGVNMVAKEALEQGLTKDAAQTLLKQQSGAFGRLAPKVGGLLSGIPADDLATASTRLPELKAIESGGVTDLAKSTQESLASTLRQAKKSTGEELQNVIESSGEKVNLKSTKAKLTELLNELKGSGLQNQATKDEIDLVESNIKNLFSQEAAPAQQASKLLGPSGKPVQAAREAVQGEIPDEVPASVAFKLQEQIKELGNLRKTTGGLTARNQKSPLSTKELENAGGDAYRALNDEFERVTTKVGGKLGNSKALKDQYREYSQIQETLGKYFKDADSTYNTLRNLGKPQKKVLLETLGNVDKRLGTSTVSDAKLLSAYSRLGKNSLPAESTLTDAASQYLRVKTPAAALGTAGGAYYGSQNGGGWGGGIVGGAAGGLAGGFAGSPSTMRNLIGLHRGLAAPSRFAAQPIWDMIRTNQMQNEENQ